MGRAPCCDKSKVKRGPWSPEEDATLKHYLQNHGTGGNWITLPQRAGLKRCGKSCRLRWLNYLRPDIKHGPFTDEEDTLILSLYQNLGSRWSVIASKLAGRTDNDVKNHWNTKLKKKFMAVKNNLITNYHSTTNIPLDHDHGPIDQSPALIPKIEAYEPLFSASLTQSPPTIRTSLANKGLSISETTSSSMTAVDNNYVLWSGGGGMINDGFPGMDFVGGVCYDFMGGFWSQESTGLEDFLLS